MLRLVDQGGEGRGVGDGLEHGVDDDTVLLVQAGAEYVRIALARAEADGASPAQTTVRPLSCGRLPEEQAKQVMLPILDGLRAVHTKGFLHRDIKPQNIYLGRLDSGGTRPILLDFGAARQAMGERSRSLSVVVSAGYAFRPDGAFAPSETFAFRR